MRQLPVLPILFPTLFAAALLFSPIDAGAAETLASEVPPPELKSKFYNQETPYAGEVTRGIITAATNQFSFVIPPGFKKLVDIKGKTLTLNSTSMTATLTFKISEDAVEGKTDMSLGALKEAVLKRFKDGRIVDEFGGTIESMSGPGFEVEWPGAVCRMSSRIAFVPYAGGHIEIVVQSPTAEFRAYDVPLATFLLTIRTSPVGTKVPVIEYLSEL